MLSKLLKYDFRALAKYGKPMALIMLGVIVLGSLGSWGLTSLMYYTFMTAVEPGAAPFFILMLLLLELFLILALIGSVTAILILSYVHFYKSLVTDEGYLTFTLPVKPSAILLSKVINGIIWQLIFVAIAVVGIVAIVGTGGLTVAGQIGADAGVNPVDPIGFTLFTDMLKELFVSDGYLLTILLALIYAFVGMVYSYLLYCMVIFFASVVSKRNKVLVAVGCILGAYFANSIITSIISLMVEIFGLIIAPNVYSYANFTMIIYSIIFAGASVLFFFLTKYMMERKLNLP